MHRQPTVELRTGQIARDELLLHLPNGANPLLLPDAFPGVASRLDAPSRRPTSPGWSWATRSSSHGELDAAAIDPSQLALQITESVAIGDADQADRFIPSLGVSATPLLWAISGKGFRRFMLLRHTAP